LLLMPQKELIAPVLLNENHNPLDDGSPFYLTPLFFYTEYIAWNPLVLAQSGQMTYTRERTYDKNSELARKCRTPNLRNEICAEVPKHEGKDLLVKNNEHLNFLFAVSSHETLYDTPVLFSFSRGEFGTGCLFANLLDMRRTDPWCNQFLARTKKRKKNGNAWFGLDITNPPLPKSGEVDMRYHAPDLCEYYGGLYEMLATKFREGLIDVDYEDGTTAESATVDASQMQKSATVNADGSPKF